MHSRCILIFVSLSACVDVDVTVRDDGASTTSFESETGDECHDYESMCLEGGLCFSRGPDWDAWALISTDEQTELLYSQTVETDPLGEGMECREHPSAGWVVCLVEHECVTITSLPLADFDIEPGSCDLDGPWESTVLTSLGECVGVFGETGTRLLPL